MSSSIWTRPAVSAEARPWAGSAWRMVEAQHVASAMKIVDGPAEQDLLEALLDGSKPAQPTAAIALDYLLMTPFRYGTRPGGSRFRGESDAGVFYGAESVRTASAELGYWRWRFLRDAVDLDRLPPVAHTAFRVDVRTSAVDLRVAPFNRDAAAWQHPSDYGPTQAFARLAREAALGAIVYQSVRDPTPSWCLAVLTPLAFAQPKPHAATQTWWLSVTQSTVIWRRDQASQTFATAGW